MASPSLFINGVDRTSFSPLKSWKLKNTGYAAVGTAQFRLIDRTPFTLTVVKEHVAVLRDQSTVRQFEGYVRRIDRRDFNVQGIRVYDVSCQDYTSDLVWNVIENGVRTVAETDQARVIWIIQQGTRSLTAASPGTGGFVQQVYGGTMPEQDFTGMNLLEAINEVRKISGAVTPYVDFDKKVHYFGVEAAQSPFDIDMQNPG